MRQHTMNPRTSGLRRLTLGLIACALVLPAMAALAATAPTRSGASADRIIISGAAGHLGELTIQSLLARGVPASHLILVTRTPDALARYARMGASVRFGDFTQPASLRAAFAGGTRMLLISIGFGAMPRPQAHGNAIDAAVADGVKQIAYTSWIGLSHGARTGLAADHFATEQRLRKSGAAWTMLRNSVYMEELLPAAKRMVATGRAVVPPGDPRIGYVARADCAAAAAAALSAPGHDDKAYDITGPALIGTRELATAVGAVTGKPITIVATPSSAAPARHAADGKALSVVSHDFERLTGRAPVTLEAFLEQHRAELLGSAH